RKALENGDTLKDEINLGELFDNFLRQKRTAEKEYNTIRRYDSLIRCYLKPKFGHMQAKQLKPLHLTNTYNDWKENGRDGKPVSGKTVRHAHDLLRNILNWGVRKDLLSRNVAKSVENDDLPKVVNPKPIALTDQQLRKLLETALNPSSRSLKRGYLSAEPWFHPAVAFAAYMGTRRGETLAVHWRDVDFDKNEVKIQWSLTEAMDFKNTKTDQTRTLTMPPSLRDILEAHRERQDEERRFMGKGYKDQDLVFARVDGSPIDPWNFGEAVTACIERAKVTDEHLTLHNLRDTHGSLCVKAGVPIEVISKRLGHSNILVTAKRYLDVQDRDAEAAAAFGKLVG
ncbi:MAG TPA: site-specific integrase, partial [Candidatus Baltobacteraceae bacterium]|nr:site-specific integrase [Candidatus Baltobacteraceae bacterium]